ncbi:MAG: glycosyltransferase family 2 protein [Bacteroidales bacterium]|nr:glycosyltransferase family 2 protein [Bacteroidales bacterium]
MLSICIGIYNWDVSALVSELSSQADSLGIDYEIVLVDDASDESYLVANERVRNIKNVVYILNEHNIGRAAIRNKLADVARFPYLLFMDCDTTVTHDDFLKKYIDEIPAEVVSGGYEYGDVPPMRENMLRWKYGHVRETVSAAKRNENPNASFSTFNFLISKEIFSKVRFDTTLQGYGHEDTLFGIELEQAGIVVKHIDNPLRHDVSVPTEKFLSQTCNAIDNLLLLCEKFPEGNDIINGIALLKAYKKLAKYHLIPLYNFFYFICKLLIKRNLYSANPSITLFDFYKLGYLCSKKP